MPRIVRYGGVNLSDEVVKIHDLAPAPAKKNRPKPAADDDAFTEVEFADGTLPEDGLYSDEPVEGALFEQDVLSASASSYAGADSAKGEIIQAAMAEASRIIQEAVQEGEDRKAELLAEAKFQSDRMQQEGYEEGRKTGLASVMAEMQDIAGKIESGIANFEGERAGFETEYEDQLRWLAIEISSKVLAKKVSEDDAELCEMVKKAVQSVKNESWVRVEVAQDMVHLIEGLTAFYEEIANVEVSGIPAESGTIHIETPSGVVDASLKTQLENLREYFLHNPN